MQSSVYLNILKTILICNIFCCFIAVYILWGSRTDFFYRYLISLMYSYIILGISGSILWFSFYHVFSKYIQSKKIAHSLSCGLASILAAPCFYFVFGAFEAVKNSLVFLKFTLPTAVVCLLFYLYRYMKFEVPKDGVTTESIK
jgi:FlaA1/EpsC-like NDP-sugar epimerase